MDAVRCVPDTLPFEAVHALSEDNSAWVALADEVGGLGPTASDRPSGLAVCALALALSGVDRRGATRLAHLALSTATDLDQMTRLIALRALGACAMYDGRLREAIEHFRDRRILAGGRGDTVADEAVLLFFVDAFEEGDALLAASRATRSESPAKMGMVADAMLTGHYLRGRFDLANDLANTIVRGSAERRAFYPRMVLGRIAQLRGDYPVSRRLLNVAASNALRSDDWFTMLLLAKASLALSEGNAPLAAERFAEVVKLTTDPPVLRNWLAAWAVDAMRAALAVGDDKLGHDIVSITHTIVLRTPGALTIAGVYAQTKAMLESDLGGLAAAEVLLRKSPRPLVRADSLVEYGRALLLAGDLQLAARALDEAWELFVASGAFGESTRIERMLVEGGLRRRRAVNHKRPTEGWEALTEAERRVARLLADGNTNARAAAHLGLTRHTVSSHARAIFGKLGIRSRVELVRIFASEPG
jgi:DNA-binding CsgD family transcriptional regulator